jgi:cyclophilin family peptidyl-prolyl cis-trans isomerase
MKRVAFIAVALLLAAFAAFALFSSNTPSGPNPVVVMETSMGTVTMELFQDKAPITVANFLKYVDAKHYDGTIFHRVMSDFMIQGGGFEPGMREKSTKLSAIRNEASNGLSNERGTIAMARTNDPHSATDQFFINVLDNKKGLDRGPGNDGYAVFGRVTDGMKVVDQIRLVKTGSARGHKDVPVEDVLIKSIRRTDAK